MSSMLSRFHRAAPLALTLAALLGCQGIGRSDGTPDTRRLHERGVALMEAGRLDEARIEYEKALLLDPLFVICSANYGLCLHLQGHSQRGIDVIQEAIRTDPDVAYCYNNLGEIYFDQRRYPKAEAQFELAVDTTPGYDDAWFNLGRVRVATGRGPEGLEAYLQAGRINPANVSAHVAAGLIYRKDGRDEKAEKYFLIALDRDPKNHYANHGLGQIAEKRERWEEAIRRYKTALEAHKIDDMVKADLAALYKKCPPRVAKALVETARASMEAADRPEKLAEALSDLEAAGRIDSKLVDVPVLTALVYLKLGNVPEAEKAINVAFAMAPRDRDVRYVRARVAVEKGSLKAAEDILRGLCREDGKSAKYPRLLGDVYLRQNQTRLAERAWLAALDRMSDEGERAEIRRRLEELLKTPRFKTANEHNDKGVTALLRGDLEEAEKCFRFAIDNDGRFAIAYSNWAMVYLERNKLAPAVEMARKAIELDPDLGRAHLNLGTAYLRQRRIPDARKEYGLAATLEPGSPEPLYHLGLVCLEEGKPREAEGRFEAARELDAKHVPSLWQLGRLCEANQLPKRAKDLYEQAVLYGPKFYPVRMDLGRLYLKLERWADAVAQFEAAAEIAPGEPEPHRGLADARKAQGDRRGAFLSLLDAADRYAARSQFDPAIDAAREAVALDDKAWEPYFLLGQYLLAVNKFSEAVAKFNESADLARDKDLRPRLMLGVCFWKYAKATSDRDDRQRYKDKAAENFKSVFDANPQIGEAWHFYGSTYETGADYNPITKPKALEALEEASQLEKDPAKRQAIVEQIAKLRSE